MLFISEVCFVFNHNTASKDNTGTVHFMYTHFRGWYCISRFTFYQALKYFLSVDLIEINLKVALHANLNFIVLSIMMTYLCT